MGYSEHTAHAAERDAPIRCAIITISDTRTTETDTSGAAIRELLTAAGHSVVHYQIVPDEPEQLAEAVQLLVTGKGCEAILTNGGTGIARRDATIEAIEPLLDKKLPGFGELFRMLSYADIGAGAMLSRATAGIAGRTLVFCMPGSTGAVRLALEKLILPEIAHLAWELIRQ
ncbi:MAG: MogA/MoaB family molybdenum cofactor biosynthesis protein [Herpetosiphonaceae bacterium]|nr:MogA/MoaB family molybdenum cofactor biosynthesis protein [Herpetosiphonaceae bacterium]